jgi:hypothetical protein
MKKIIVNHLYQILYAEEEVQFHNVYRGVPIGYAGRIVEIGKQTVRFQTHPHQVFCMKQDGFTHIESNLLPGLVHADVLSVDIPAHCAMLGNFSFTDPDFNPHEDVRVEPPEPLPIVLWYEEEKRFTARLQAVSLRGLTVNLDPDPGEHNPQQLHSGEMIQARFGFSPKPGEKTIIGVEGRIRQITMQNGAHCLDIQIFPPESQQKFLAHYIARRQKEILAEIRSLTRQVLEKTES